MGGARGPGNPSEPDSKAASGVPKARWGAPRGSGKPRSQIRRQLRGLRGRFGEGGAVPWRTPEPDSKAAPGSPKTHLGGASKPPKGPPFLPTRRCSILGNTPIILTATQKQQQPSQQQNCTHACTKNGMYFKAPLGGAKRGFEIPPCFCYQWPARLSGPWPRAQNGRCAPPVCQLLS